MNCRYQQSFADIGKMLFSRAWAQDLAGSICETIMDPVSGPKASRESAGGRFSDMRRSLAGQFAAHGSIIWQFDYC